MGPERLSPYWSLQRAATAAALGQSLTLALPVLQTEPAHVN